MNSSYIKISFAVLMLAILTQFAYAENNDSLSKAVDLYRDNNLFDALNVISKLEETSPKSIYYVWLIEKRIGKQAHAYSRDEESSNHKYYEYVKNHPQKYTYYEPAGSYWLSAKRHGELVSRSRDLDPTNEFLPKMAIFRLREKYQAYAEGGLHSMSLSQVNSILEGYQEFIKEYPYYVELPKVKKELSDLSDLRGKLFKDVNGSSSGSGHKGKGGDIANSVLKKEGANRNENRSYRGYYLYVLIGMTVLVLVILMLRIKKKN